MPFRDNEPVWECDACGKLIQYPNYVDIEMHCLRHFANPVNGVIRYLIPWYCMSVSWLMLIVFLLRT